MNLVRATKDNLNEIAYLWANADVALSVMEGHCFSGYAHFIQIGMSEGRNQVLTSKNDASFEAHFQAYDLSRAQKTVDSNLLKLIESVIKPGMKLLEIGSTEVTGPGHLRGLIEAAGGNM